MAHSHKAQWKAAQAHQRDEWVLPSVQEANIGKGGFTKLKVRESVASVSLEDLEEKELASKDKKAKKKFLADEDSNSDADLEQFDDSDDEVSSDEERGGGEDGNDSGADDSDDDEEEELRKQLEKIRKERTAEKERRVAEEAEIAMRVAKREDDGETASNVGLKRRWDADVVFQNQAQTEKPKKPRFINDTLRSDFQRAFLKKYVK